jgi:hypothetical protein
MVGVPGKGTSERRSADQPEVDEDLPEPLTSLDLSPERELDLAVVDRTLLHEHPAE